MPYLELRRLVALAVGACLAPQLSWAVDPHLDPSRVPGSCRACHVGHGVSRSPMLSGPQASVCLACHGSRAQADQQTARGLLGPNGQPSLISDSMAKPYRHPMTEGAMSRREPGVVTCTSCHSPHRASANSQSRVDSSTLGRKLSTRDPNQFEYELCQSCHGNQGATTLSLSDISRMTTPSNRSFHPIEAPAAEKSQSLLPEVAGIEINCTDCHGNDNPSGARGPHGSSVRYLLMREYVTTDGSPEQPQTYLLCYECHSRQAIFETSPFTLHRTHVADERASCATCHSAHGSIGNRALIRFGEETIISGVSPSMSTGILDFVSEDPGSGSCFLTCHGVDHAPLSYGLGGDEIFEARSDSLIQPASGSQEILINETDAGPLPRIRKGKPRRPPPQF